MTSILINSFREREEGAESLKNLAQDGCPFCAIIQGELPAFKVYEDDKVLAFLDILPIRRGHTLLVPKTHHEKMTTLSDEFSAHMGQILPRLCRAVCKATNQSDFNIVNNNGYAQVVPHVHWHIVPAPDFNAQQPFQRQPGLAIGLQELQRREELDDKEAQRLASSISLALESDTRSRL